MASKPLEYRIKSWVACNVAFSCTLMMQVYIEKPNETLGNLEKNQELLVVLNQREGLRGQHNITGDNFYTFYKLG